MSDICTACGYEARLHYDDRQQMVGCAGAARLAPVDKGRLIQLKLRQNETLRQEARGTIRGTPSGKYSVRIGGRLRGHWHVFLTRQQCEDAAEQYYNERALAVAIDTTVQQEKEHGHNVR